jgi:uncharacterized protein (DUF433 family)
MNALKTVEDLLPSLTRSEKAQLLQQIAREIGDAFPGIESLAEVNGGDPSVVRTRIPVWLLVQMRQAGATDAELLHNYPSLRAEDLTNAWAFYRSHKAEIDAQIHENEEA